MDADVAGGAETGARGVRGVDVFTRRRRRASRRKAEQRAVGRIVDGEDRGLWLGRARERAASVFAGGDLFHRRRRG